MFGCNRCKNNFKNFQDMSTHFKVDHTGETLTLKHYFSNRGNQEFFQENFDFAKELFKKK